MGTDAHTNAERWKAETERKPENANHRNQSVNEKWSSASFKTKRSSQETQGLPHLSLSYTHNHVLLSHLFRAWHRQKNVWLQVLGVIYSRRLSKGTGSGNLENSRYLNGQIHFLHVQSQPSLTGHRSIYSCAPLSSAACRGQRHAASCPALWDLIRPRSDITGISAHSVRWV